MSETAQIVEAETRAGDEPTAYRRLARIYAESLLNVALKRNQVDAAGAELNSIVNDLFQAAPSVETLLESPAVKRSAKEEILKKAFQGQLSDLVFDFISVLNHHDRLGLLRIIRTAYHEILDDRAKRVRVRVRSAVALSQNQQKQLGDTIRKQTGLEPVFEQSVEPEILGGMILQVGDDVYDSSVRTRIESLRNQLLARSSHEIQSQRDRISTHG
jgi:F-type H+-transporting ATPase subunit delta